MSTQQTAWGNIDWLDLTNPADNVYTRMGVETVEGHSYQRQHMHYDEQIIHVLSGRGRHWINNRVYGLAEGRSFYLPAGTQHELINDGELPLQFTIVSTVMPYIQMHGMNSVFAARGFDRTESLKDFESDPLSFALNKLSAELGADKSYPFTVFDGTGHPLFISDYYPLTCRQECGEHIAGGSCSCMRLQDNESFHFDTTFTCRHGLRMFSVPIVYNNHTIGYIHGGYIRNADSSNLYMPGDFSLQQSTVDSVFAFLRGITKTIDDYCHLTALRLHLEQSDRLQATIKKDLRRKEFELSNLKINYHFLFNTMNSMAAMALESNSITLYQSIIRLSSLFQYTLRSREESTTLDKEVSYVTAYLELQKLRYKDSLATEISVDEAARHAVVPVNFLQPLVENAFTHGFERVDKKEVRVSAYIRDDRLCLYIRNNGATMSSNEYAQINENAKRNPTHGIGMVYGKLSMLFDDFSMDLSAGSPNGSLVSINAPFWREMK